MGDGRLSRASQALQRTTRTLHVGGNHRQSNRVVRALGKVLPGLAQPFEVSLGADNVAVGSEGANLLIEVWESGHTAQKKSGRHQQMLGSSHPECCRTAQTVAKDGDCHAAIV